MGQHRSTQRKKPLRPDDETALTADITALAIQYGRHGYRRITAMLRDRGWRVNARRVARIWRADKFTQSAQAGLRGAESPS